MKSFSTSPKVMKLLSGKGVIRIRQSGFSDSTRAAAVALVIPLCCDHRPSPVLQRRKRRLRVTQGHPLSGRARSHTDVRLELESVATMRTCLTAGQEGRVPVGGQEASDAWEEGTPGHTSWLARQAR